MPSTAPQAAGIPFITNFVHDPNYKSHFPSPIFEIIRVEGFEQDDGLVYRLHLSDGRHSIWGILVPYLHGKVDSEEIKVHALIKLNAYYLETYKGKRFIAVEDLEVLSPQVQHLGIDRSNDEIRDPNAVNPSNEAHVSTSALKRESVYDMKERVMLGDIGSLRDRTLGNYLVVVVGKRRDKAMGKQDYYLWDSSSPIIGGKLRKTVLSVWRCLRKDFHPNPGTIVALRGVTKLNTYEEHPTEPKMTYTYNMGHLNAWKSTVPKGSPWFLIDPTQVEGYDELKVAWEEQQYDLIDFGGDVIIQEMSLIGDL